MTSEAIRMTSEVPRMTSKAIRMTSEVILDAMEADFGFWEGFAFFLEVGDFGMCFSASAHGIPK